MELISNDYLAHYGIPKRSGRYPYGSGENPRAAIRDSGGKQTYTKEQKKVLKAAKKDAEEYAQAKVSYGEGSGNRRKLIKAKVEERSKDPLYKEEFDRQLAAQDMAKRADQARREHDVHEVTTKTAKTARGLINIAAGKAYAASSAAITIAAVAAFVHNTGADRAAIDFVKAKFG